MIQKSVFILSVVFFLSFSTGSLAVVHETHDLEGAGSQQEDDIPYERVEPQENLQDSGFQGESDIPAFSTNYETSEVLLESLPPSHFSFSWL